MKKLVFIDFDGTLMNTPMPDVGKKMWEDKYGKKYPHKGWWSKTESLDLNVFDIKQFPNILRLLKKYEKDPNAFIVLLSSRLKKLQPEIEKILDKNNITVDDFSLEYGRENKADRIKNYLNKFPEVKEIDIFDDREKEFEVLKGLRNDLKNNIRLNIYKANNGNISMLESNNKILNIIKEEIKNYIGSIYRKI